MIEFETDVLDIMQRTPDVKSFRFKTKGDIDFKPGQFFVVTIKINDEERSKHFSFSNSPTEKGYIEFTKRITESEFSKALDKLKIGDWAKLKMPYGSFTFEGEHEKLAFLSGGIGITPLRCIIKFVSDKKLPTNIVLFYSNKTEEDIIFRQDLDNISSSNKNIRVIYTLTSKDIDNKAWQGKTGYIDNEMIKEVAPDFLERIFYICGPPMMVGSMKDILKNKLNLPENMIKIENFAGY